MLTFLFLLGKSQQTKKPLAVKNDVPKSMTTATATIVAKGALDNKKKRTAATSLKSKKVVSAVVIESPGFVSPDYKRAKVSCSYSFKKSFALRS